jgi:hypothetical protein
MFVDHPGLPLTEAATIAFGVDNLLKRGNLSDQARLSYANEQLLDLDRTRGIFRGIAIVVYVLGAALAFVLLARLLGHWTWGFAAGLLWLAAPGLAAMSIQLRPDVALAVLTLVFAYLIGRAVATRSALLYGLAAFVVGFAVMVKLHALALLVPLSLATIWRPPDRHARAQMRRDLAAFERRRRLLIATAVSTWLVLAFLLNRSKFPFPPKASQLGALALVVGAAGGYAAAAFAAARITALRRVEAVFDRLPAYVVLAFAAGLLLPVTLSVDDGLSALVYLGRNLRGEGVQAGIEPFSTPLSQLDDIVSVRVVVFFLIGALAGVVGIARRDPRPVVWTVGALAAGAFAYARPPNVHYFAPAYVLCIPAVLWLLRPEPRARASFLIWPVVLYLVWPVYDHRNAPAAEAEQFAQLVAPAKAYAEPRLEFDDVVLVPSYWPFADSRYFELVRDEATRYGPEYPYRYLPITAKAADYAADRRLRPRYFIGPQASDVVGTEPRRLGAFGDYRLRRVPGRPFLAELVSGPGVDRPWPTLR